MDQKKIAVLIGSLRKNSFNRMMANHLMKYSPRPLRLETVSISTLPMYNQDLDENPPKAWIDFKNEIRQFDGFLFMTPEYNRSVPAILKNAIDIGSRPYGHNIWDGKPAAIISVSTGAIGGFGANHHLRQSLVFLNVPVMQQPEAYIGGAAKLFDENGELASDSTRDFMNQFLNEFSNWINNFSR